MLSILCYSLRCVDLWIFFHRWKLTVENRVDIDRSDPFVNYRQCLDFDCVQRGKVRRKISELFDGPGWLSHILLLTPCPPRRSISKPLLSTYRHVTTTALVRFLWTQWILNRGSGQDGHQLTAIRTRSQRLNPPRSSSCTLYQFLYAIICIWHSEAVVFSHINKAFRKADQPCNAKSGRRHWEHGNFEYLSFTCIDATMYVFWRHAWNVAVRECRMYTWKLHIRRSKNWIPLWDHTVWFAAGCRAACEIHTICTALIEAEGHGHSDFTYALQPQTVDLMVSIILTATAPCTNAGQDAPFLRLIPIQFRWVNMEKTRLVGKHLAAARMSSPFHQIFYRADNSTYSTYIPTTGICLRLAPLATWYTTPIAYILRALTDVAVAREKLFNLTELQIWKPEDYDTFGPAGAPPLLLTPSAAPRYYTTTTVAYIGKSRLRYRVLVSGRR